MTPHLPRLFLWHVVRDVRRHPLLMLLNVGSVALGIAVYLAIQIAHHSANRSFAATVDLVAGKAHLEVRGEVPESLWPQLSKQPGVAVATGIVEGLVTLPDFPGRYLRVLGIDVFSGEAFRTFGLRAADGEWDIEGWLRDPRTIAVSADFAQRHGLKAGDALRASVNGRIETLTILSLIDTSDAPAAQQQPFAAMDIGWAQELFGRAGKLSAIHLRASDASRIADLAAQLNQTLPPHLRAEPPRQRSTQLQSMVAAFQLNLTAMSLVSLLVGIFLVYNTISASVTRRRREIGILRAVGATRGEVRALFLGEACFFGVLGIALGSLAGVALAHVLAAPVAKTITSLYVLVSIERISASPVEFFTAALFGTVAVIAGAWLPASEASRVEPVGALSLGAHAERSGARSGRWTAAAIGLLLLGGAASWAALLGGWAPLTFAAAFFVLAGFSLFSPAVTSGFGKAAARLGRARIVWRIGADNLRRSVSRNSVTVAALASAIAMLTGLTIMIFSFRESVSAWIERGVIADLFIAPAANETVGISATMPPGAVAWLRSRPEVAAVDTLREERVPVRVGGGEPREGLLLAIEGAYRDNLRFIGGGAAEKMARVFRGEAIAVTESFARKYRVEQGARVTLVTPRGEAAFSVAGIYSDYSRDQGVMLIDRRVFDRFWDDGGVHSLAVFLRPGAAGEAVADAFRAEFGSAGEFAVYSNRAIRARILTVFDQTFAVTGVLRTVAFIVAIAGVYLSVTTLVTEREREIGMLRAVGASRGQIQRLLMTEAGLMSIVASGLGLASGFALAVVLTWVVNPAFFGWTISLRVPWPVTAATPVWIALAAILAAWHPAWQATRRNIADAVREE